MKVREWITRRRSIDDAFYEELVATAGCGPFDGGCVVVAEALSDVIGGEVVVLTRTTGGCADHAAVLLDGKLWDYDGPMDPKAFMTRFERDELKHVPWGCAGYRPIRDDDLEGACRGSELRERLADLFREMLPDLADGPRP